MTTSGTSASLDEDPDWRPPPEFAADLLERYGLTCPPMWGTPRRPEFPSLGPKAWRVMQRLGFEPMPWQKYVLDVALEIDPATGVFAHREVGLSVPRQQGKTQQVLALMVHRVAAWQRQRVVYAAQTRGMARERFEDEFLVTMDASSLAGKYRTRMSNGNEAIIWSRTRSKIGITANTEKAGHGPALDLGVIDEAFAHEDDRVEQAMSPAQVTKEMAQLWWASAGGTEKSVWLNKKRGAGRELIELLWETGLFPRIAYFEWFAPSHLPRDDPATWGTCLPALGFTITPATIQAELEKLDPNEFDRAYLNRTRKKDPPTDPNVPKKAWPGLKHERPQPGGDVAFAIEVSHDRAWSSVVAAELQPDGRVHLELVDRRPGTDWVIPAIVKLRSLWDPVAVVIASIGSPSRTLIDDLIAAGVKVPEDRDEPTRGDLIIMRTGELVEACGQMADAITQRAVAHIDQADMTGAVNGAMTKPSGDAWVLDRRKSLSDVTPFYGATLARWALLIVGPKVQRDYDVMDSVG